MQQNKNRQSVKLHSTTKKKTTKKRKSPKLRSIVKKETIQKKQSTKLHSIKKRTLKKKKISTKEMLKSTKLKKQNLNQQCKQKKISTVMKEFKIHKLKMRNGQPVTNRKQAIAIALSEAGRKCK